MKFAAASLISERPLACSLAATALLALCACGARVAMSARSARAPAAASAQAPALAAPAHDVDAWLGAEGHLHAEALAFVVALHEEARALAASRPAKTA